MKMKYITLAILSCALVACSEEKKSKVDVRNVKVYVVNDTNNSELVNFHGIVHAEYEPTLSFRVDGKITKRNVNIGQQVTKGQILATLDPTDYQLAVAAATADVAATKSNLMTQEANLERYRQLVSENFVSKAQFDVQQSNYASALANYKQAQSKLSNTQNQVLYSSLIAPDTGVISSVEMDAGQVVTAGQTVATMAISGKKEVVIELPEAQINNYKVGMPATINMWAHTTPYQGVIRVINLASDSKTRTYMTRITINNPDDKIKYGMAASVNLKPLNEINGTMIPLSSVYAKDGKSAVWSIGADSTVKLEPIEIIASDGAMVKVKSGMLHSGTNIVSAGVNLLYAGQKVQVYKQ